MQGFAMGKIKEKIKKLRNFKVYNYSIFDERELNAAQSYISRASARGELVKLGKGKFAKIGNKRLYSDIFVKTEGLDMEAIKTKKIRTDKYHEFKQYFWSNTMGVLSLDDFIACVLKYDVIVKFMELSTMFGGANVYRVYLERYRSKGERLKMIEEYIYG